MSSLTIKPNAALDDAKAIDEIMNRIDADMQKLNETIKSVIPDGIRTDWSESIRGNWEKYYVEDIPEAMAAIKASATNLRLAVEETLRYSKGQ